MRGAPQASDEKAGQPAIPLALSPRILIVEDDAVSALFLRRTLEALGCRIVGCAKSGEEALQQASQQSPDVIFCDIMLEGGMDGIQVTDELRKRMDLPVVYTTANSDPDTIDRAKRTCPSGYLVKPLKPAAIKSALELALYRHKTEALQRLHERAVAASQSAVIVVDANGSEAPIIRVNTAFERMTGFTEEEAVGQSCWFLEGSQTDPTEANNLREALRERRPFRTTLLQHRKDGGAFWGDLTVTPVPDAAGCVTHFMVVANDVTRVRELEAQLRQAQKLEAIGQLAAGIAHEINTPAQYVGDNITFLREAFSELASVWEGFNRLLAAAKAGAISTELLANTETIIQSVDADYLMGEIPKAIDQALQGIDRVSRIVRAMKEFSHPGTHEKVFVDLNAVIESTLTVCRNEWKYVAELVTHLDTALPPVSLLPGEINQALLNLIVNASHAIAETVGNGGNGKGRITVSTQREGDWAVVRIADTGCGIPESIRHRVFDPFFTTKGVGKGTGQGLAIAWAVVVEKHGGQLSFDTEAGKGATFVMRLPLKPLATQHQQAA